MNLSEKQKQILTCLIFGDMESEEVLTKWLSMDKLLDILPYHTSRESMHFSMRALIAKKLVRRGARELRDSRWKTPYIPTDLAMDLIPVLKPEEIVVSVDEMDDSIMFEGFEVE